MEESSLPLYIGAVDHLRHGFRSLQEESSQRHPVEKLQRHANEYDLRSKMDAVQQIYGNDGYIITAQLPPILFVILGVYNLSPPVSFQAPIWSCVYKQKRQYFPGQGDFLV